MANLEPFYWNYRQPVRIIFGEGRITELPQEINTLGCKQGLLVTSKGFVKRGMAQHIIDQSAGLLTALYGEVAANPDITQVEYCQKIITDHKIDFVVALGGGSVMDCAKAAKGALPLICVPTTAGTGSEITSVAVISDHRKGTKASFSRDEFFPTLAIIDPELTYSVPPRLTACTGFDAMCHAIEAFWSRHHLPVGDALAVASLQLALPNLQKAYDQPHNVLARRSMAEASVLAGLAFATPKTSAPHACSYPLTNLYGIPHGEACILTMPAFIRYNDAHGDPRIGNLARQLGFGNADEMATRIEQMRNDMGMRSDLRDLQLSDDQLRQLVKACHHPNLKNNPVEVTDDFLYQMFNDMR